MDDTWKAERRLVLRLLRYWEMVRGARSWPAPGDIDPAALAADWDDCMMIDLGDPAAGPVFRHVGARLHADAWPLAAGSAVADAPKGSLLRPATGFVAMVTERKAPVSIGGQYESADNGVVLYRAILMPLSSDGLSIDTVFGGANRRPVDLEGATLLDPAAGAASRAE